MAKNISSAMRTHLQSEVTTLATGWKITRTDGVVFRFTTNAEDVDIDVGDGDGEQTYSASEGYNRTAIQSDADLTITNMDIVGIFDDDAIKEDELKRGLFDFAEVRIFLFNHQDTSQGVVKQLRGFLGEVVVTDRGFFQVELRDLLQVYTQKLGEHYSKDCRADLGDQRCRLPLFPDVLGREQQVAVGDVFRVRTDPEPSDFGCHVLLVPFDGEDGATAAEDFSEDDRTLTFNNGAQLDTAVTKFGTASLLLDGTNDDVTVPASDDWTFGGAVDATGRGQFSIRLFVNPAAAGAGTNRYILTHFRASGSDRSWLLRVNTDETVTFAWYFDGVNFNEIVSTATLAADTFTHIEVSRDGAGDIRLFVGGNLEATATGHTGAFHDAEEPLRIGSITITASPEQFFEGHLDDLNIVLGKALHTSSFTPPASAIPTTDPDVGLDVTFDMFEDRVYRVTQAGTTHICDQPAYDTTPGNTTQDGTAVLEANESWTRFAEVSEVVEARRVFKVTELTPNTAHTVDDGVMTQAGFPDDFFNGGAAVFESGDNAGRAAEVRDFIADDGVTIEQQIELFTDLPFDIQVGDTLRVQAGCDKLFTTCRDKFDNVINFVGEPYVPGADMMGQYPNARS